MGEYATRKSDGESIKIGTCESMYYLRYEDRHSVTKRPHSLDPANCQNLFWRLPFPDEDKILAGEYNEYGRGLRLYKNVDGWAQDYTSPDLAERPGTIQLRDAESGLLLNVPCHHGEKLPELGNAKAFWNGKGHSYELAHLKNTPNGILPVIRCRHCGFMWRMDWADIWQYIERPMQERLAIYSELTIAEKETA
jgi:hypothetical protein